MQIDDRSEPDEQLVLPLAQVLHHSDDLIDAEVLEEVAFARHVDEDW